MISDGVRVVNIPLLLLNYLEPIRANRPIYQLGDFDCYQLVLGWADYLNREDTQYIWHGTYTSLSQAKALMLAHGSLPIWLKKAGFYDVMNPLEKEQGDVVISQSPVILPKAGIYCAPQLVYTVRESGGLMLSDLEFWSDARVLRWVKQ